MNDKEKLENARWMNQDQPLEFWHTQALQRIKNGPVLDIGSGDGLLLGELKERNIEVFGVDVSESGIRKARGKGLVVYQGDIANLDSIQELKGKKFNTITILEVLEHLFHPQDTLAGVRMLIDANGDLYVSTPNFNCFSDRVAVLFGNVPPHKYAGKGHVYWMNKRILKRLIERNNFEIIEFVGLGYSQTRLWAPLGRLLAQMWPSLFALSFFVHAKPKK